MTFAFAPFNLIFLLIPAFYLLLKNIYGQTFKTSFYYGFIFGFSHFITSLYWLAIALTSNVGNFIWLIPFALILIPMGLGIYTGLICLTAQIFRLNRALFCFGFSLIWSLVEFFRGYFPIPFPWNFIGYTVSNHEILLKLAPYFGVHLLTFILLVLSTIIFSHKWKLCMGIYFSFFILIFLLNVKEPDEDNWDDMVRIIQPNILDHHLGRNDKQLKIMDDLIELSTFNLPSSVKAIIWPEAAYPFLFKGSLSEINTLRRLAPKEGYLIMGADRIDEEKHIYNSIITIDDLGRVISLYDKHILVPFGEFIPLRKILWFIDKIAYGIGEFEIGNPFKNFKSKLPNFFPLICYEILFSIEEKLDNYEWLLNITNDAWFGDSIGPYQHLAMVKFKAAEYQLPIIRVANNGVSSVISANGKITDKLNLNVKGFIDVKIPKKYTPIKVNLKKYDTAILIILFLICLCFNLAITNNTYIISERHE